MFKKIALVSLILLVVAVMVAAIVLRPYYKMPDEPKEALDAKLAEFQTYVKEMRERPMQDREALDALIEDMGNTVKGENLSPDGCPAFSPEFLESKKSIIKQIAAYENRYAAMLQDGFLLQHEGHAMSEMPNFFTVRMYMYQQAASAVISKNNGDSEKMLAHLGNIVKIVDGLERAPGILFVYIGFAGEGAMNQAIVYLLPSLDAGEIAAIRKMIVGLPDGRARFIESMKCEVAMFVEMFDQVNSGAKIPGLEEGSDSGKILGPFTGIAKAIGYLTRERYMYLNIAVRDIEGMEAWLAEGGEGKLSTLTSDDFKYTFLAAMGWPNTRNLMEKASEKMTERAAVLEAMDLELKRRNFAQKPEIEIPYGDKNKIVLKSEYGCVVKIE